MIDVLRPLPGAAIEQAVQEGNFSDAALIKCLHLQFLGKCYLCEEELRLRDFEVEHIHPQNDRAWKEHKHNWNNLAAAHNGCNKVRLQPRTRSPWLVPGGWEGGAGVEARLIQKMHPQNSYPVFRARNKGDLAAENTAAEQNHIFNGKTPKCEERREHLKNYVSKVDNTIRELKKAAAAGNYAEAEGCLQKLRLYLSRTSPFTALARSRVPPEYHDLFDHPTDHAPK